MTWPTRCARPEWGINHVLAYGQSLSSGWEGWPALSTAPRLDNLMLGKSVRPAGESTPAWAPVGEPMFRPLLATVQDIATGAPITAAQVAQAAPDAPLLGETVLEGALNHWRARMLQDAGVVTDSAHLLLASSCGVGGRGIEELSRNATPDLFNRMRDCARRARDTARAWRRSYGIAAIILLQGEHNNWGINGSTSDRDTYKALLRRLYADIIVDVAAGIAGQTAPPAMFMHQVGGAYASADNAIPQAQLETALELPTCFLAAPIYPVTDKGGHLDANGYRWIGAQFGKVMHRVLSRGEDWRPLHPLRATRDGDAIDVVFHVPRPPLAWGRPYAWHEARDIPDRGFAVFDERGPVPIADVALVGGANVRITPTRPVGAQARVRYADAAHSGRGSLHDSDAEVAEDKYEFTPGAGHWATAAIAELMGKPYPLMNWCVAFAIDVD